MAIRQARGKRGEWFEVTGDHAELIAGLPGAKLVPRIEGFEIPRNMLGLFEDATASAFMLGANTTPRSDLWAARDARTAPLGFTLRTTQQQAIDFITQRRGTLLADDMRLGKTLTSIMCHDFARGPLWIIAPLSTRAMWLGWLARAFPGVPVGVLIGKTYDAKRLEAPIVFGHYEIIHGWQVLKTIGTLVLDEAHMLVNGDSKRSIAAAIFQSRAEMVIAMTGTPIWTLPPDLWNVIGLVAPGQWGNFYDFATRYGAPKSTAYGTEYTGVSNEAELKIRLADIMLRRRWVDVRDDLPPISRSVIVSEVDEALARKLDILAGALKSERSNTAGNLAAYRRTVSKAKAPTVIAEARKIRGRGEPLVIWTWHKDLAEEISGALQTNVLDGEIRSLLIHGDVEPSQREARMKKWRELPNAALVATMAVAQVGIDLSHARLAIFAEIDYTPAILAQAEMRTYSPDRPMDIMFVVANHMVDQRIVRALVHKLSASDPLGVGAAIDAIDALRDAVLGPRDDGDLDRLLEDLLASAD